jgi:hypothetical protein
MHNRGMIYGYARVSARSYNVSQATISRLAP